MDGYFDVIIVHHPTSNPVRPLNLAAMGLLSLAERLHRHGIRSQVVHLGVELRVDPDFDLIDFLASHQVKVLGLSLHWFFQLPDTLALASQVRDRLPHVRIVLGGFTASLFAHDLLADFPCVDAVIRGDGEAPLLAFCQHCLSHHDRDWHHLPNLAFRDADGHIVVNDHSHTITEAELDDCRFANMNLLRHHDVAFRPNQRATNRFHDRMNFDRDGFFLLQTGRGCSFSCSLCGGNWEAQRMAYARRKPLLRSPESIIRTIRHAMTFGYRNFYTCFDPDPTGQFYLRLFEQIREAKLDIRFGFEPWGLPSSALVDALADTFHDAMIVLTADTADEQLRRIHKGCLSFTNAELLQTLEHIDRRGLACQLFFGFFLPGDNAQSMMMTRRFAYDCQQRFDCEVMYMAFSTDPASPVYLHPDHYKVAIGVSGLRDYLDALAKKRMTPNLMEHRPANLSPETAELLTLVMSLDSFVAKVLPVSMRLMMTWAKVPTDQIHKLFEDFLFQHCHQHDPLTEFTAQSVSNALVAHIQSNRECFDDLTSALCDLISFEAAPYAIKERLSSSVGVHFARICRLTHIEPDQQATSLAAGDAAEDTISLQHDIPSVFHDLRAGSSSPPPSRALDVVFHVQKSGEFCTRVADANH